MQIIKITHAVAVTLTAAIVLTATLPALISARAAAADGAAVERSELDHPATEKIEAYKTYDPGPKLQQAPGGGLIVNVFIMEGPVRLEIHDRESDEVLFEKQEGSMFPFEVSRRELGVDATQVVVYIYVAGELAHKLDLLPARG
jgi:hypothetical protein